MYETVPEVRERMAELANKRLCKDVKAVYFFDLLGKKKLAFLELGNTRLLHNYLKIWQNKIAVYYI